MREALDALDWARQEIMRFGSPDFIRQREIEARVRRLCAPTSTRERQSPR